MELGQASWHLGACEFSGGSLAFVSSSFGGATNDVGTLQLLFHHVQLWAVTVPALQNLLGACGASDMGLLTVPKWELLLVWKIFLQRE